MSSQPRVGYVVEGQTDFTVIDELISRFLGTDNYVPARIQPPYSEITNHLGDYGGGWKGVFGWASDIGSNQGGITTSAVLANTDFLVIHVDADIASKTDGPSELSSDCPPARQTCDNIRNHLTGLLGAESPKIVYCIPAQATEAWVFAALHYDETSKYDPLECRPDVADLLINKPHRLVRGGSKKQVVNYVRAAREIANGWRHACQVCPEAARFEAEFKAAMQQY